jgi:MHS family proline/betaine transporter-like MFS transporter
MGTQPAHKTQTVVAGVIGNVLEWYDFALFGFLTPVIAPLFFPSTDRLASLLDTFGVFALGFLMRPVGGILFGHIGDRFGRKVALQWSVLLMAIPTTILGLLPTHAQVGVLAPLLLTLLRMLQGISVGGEFIGSMSFLGEHATPARRGFIGSWCTFSGGLGNLMGSGMATLITGLIPEPHLSSWGWRVPFLGGLAVGLIGFWLRRGVTESPRFEEAVKAGQTARSPVFLALQQDRKGLLLTVGLALMLSVGFYLPWVWLSTYLSRINSPHLPLSTALEINTFAMAVMIVLIPVGGLLSDRFGRKRVMVLGCAALAVAVYPLFVLLSSGRPRADLEAQLVIAALAAMVQGPAPAAFVELFPTRTRYSGIALAYNGTLALLGGTTPLIATWLIDETGYARAPAFYLLAAVIGCGIAAWCMTDRTGQELP